MVGIALVSGAVIRWTGPGGDDGGDGTITLGDDAGGKSTLGDDAGGAGSVDGTLSGFDELKMARRLSMARSCAWQLS
jgi:hypothetical protein